MYNHLGFDGEDYMKLDLEGKNIYIPQIQEAANNADSWNNTTDLLQHFLQFITDTWSMAELVLTEQVGLLPRTEAF